MSVKTIDTAGFEAEVTSFKGVVFVDFYAEWCGPCKMTSPIIDEMAEDPQFKDVKFLKVDVDANQELASQYNIFSIPTFIVYKDGEVVNHFSGARDKAGFEKELKPHLL